MTQPINTAATNESAIVNLMRNYAEYNLWANTTLVNWFKSKNTELLDQFVASSFPSIKATIVHIWQTERYWLSILQHRTAETYNEFNGSVTEALDGLLQQSEELASYINTLSEKEIEDTTEIINPWFQSDFQNLEYIMHACNHSTYHRGQLITMARNLGLTDPPMTDYNFYNVKVRVIAQAA